MKNYTFSADIMPYETEFERNHAIDGKFFDDNIKFENGKTYTVSEILQLQNGETLDSHLKFEDRKTYSVSEILQMKNSETLDSTDESTNSLVDKF